MHIASPTVIIVESVKDHPHSSKSHLRATSKQVGARSGTNEQAAVLPTDKPEPGGVPRRRFKLKHRVNNPTQVSNGRKDGHRKNKNPGVERTSAKPQRTTVEFVPRQIPEFRLQSCFPFGVSLFVANQLDNLYDLKVADLKLEVAIIRQLYDKCDDSSYYTLVEWEGKRLPLRLVLVRRYAAARRLQRLYEDHQMWLDQLALPLRKDNRGRGKARFGRRTLRDHSEPFTVAFKKVVLKTDVVCSYQDEVPPSRLSHFHGDLVEAVRTMNSGLNGKLIGNLGKPPVVVAHQRYEVVTQEVVYWDIVRQRHISKKEDKAAHVKRGIAASKLEVRDVNDRRVNYTRRYCKETGTRWWTIDDAARTVHRFRHGTKAILAEAQAREDELLRKEMLAEREAWLAAMADANLDDVTSEAYAETFWMDDKAPEEFVDDSGKGTPGEWYSVADPSPEATADYFRDEDALNHEASDVDAEWKHWAETKLTV